MSPALVPRVGVAICVCVWGNLLPGRSHRLDGVNGSVIEPVGEKIVPGKEDPHIPTPKQLSGLINGSAREN